jgi:signal transduction histidine kinase
MAWTHPRQLSWLLAVTTVVPIAILAWLGAWVLQQDRAAEAQREREALGVTAGRLALDIDLRLNSIADRLALGEGVALTAGGPVASAEWPLLYGPATEFVRPLVSEELADIEALEYQTKSLASAAEGYRRLARSPDTELRAAALLGLGRVLRKRGDSASAIQTYGELEALGEAAVVGQPAALVAQQARARLFEEIGDDARLQQEVAQLARALEMGGWGIDRATFDVYADLLRRWNGPTPSESAMARSDAAIGLWQTWRDGRLPPRGRSVSVQAGLPVLAIWVGDPSQPIAWFKTSDELEAELGGLWAGQPLAVSAHTVEGQPLFGVDRPGSVALTPAETHLPFILSVAPLDPAAASGRDRMRRVVLIGSLSLAFVLMGAAAYGVYRATTRELALARQQTDFVSAVSHEFRTPLTSMRHLTDLLGTRGVTSEERRAHYVELLTHETERLHRMVETLLSFGRIEAGAYAWHLESVDVGELVRSVVDDFTHEPQAKGRAITCDVEPALPSVVADTEALTRALINLLENAVKYSPAGTPIRVFARRSASMVHLGVNDHGLGIPSSERDRIFQKFERGADAKDAGIGGVGIGLALVKRIAEGHGGTVFVESEPGEGSTFTIELPATS